MRAYFTEGEPIGERAVLARLASEVGVPEAGEVLESGGFADGVRADEHEAGALGIHGVPFFVLDRRFGIEGAQPAELIVRALEQAWAERAAAA